MQVKTKEQQLKGDGGRVQPVAVQPKATALAKAAAAAAAAAGAALRPRSANV